MWRSLILLILIIFLYFRLKNLLAAGLLKIQDNLEKLKQNYKGLLQENDSLKQKNAGLKHILEEKIALYDITRQICKSLDEAKVFNLFQEQLRKHIKIEDCRFLNKDSDLSEFQDYTVLPIQINIHLIGYLLVKGISVEDMEKFTILTHQLLLGIKRAYLYQKLQELTITDFLTGVSSRRYFLERLSEEMERCGKMKREFSLLMVDADNFKAYNDHYGHLVGDAILKEIAKTIQENIRQIDLIGRYGGEEFTIILAQTGKDEAEFAAERIRQAVETRRIKIYDEDLRVTISLGISTFAFNIEDPKVLIEKADTALYQAKRSGKNTVRYAA